MAKGGQKQTQTTTSGLTGQSQGLQNDIYNSARNAAQQYQTVGPNAGTTAAMSGYQNYANAGANGLAALGGDSAQMAKLMNPYQSQVMDQMMQRYGTMAGRLNNASNDAATQAGAFGGSRHALAGGIAQGELASNQMGQMAQLAQSGYQNAQGVAGQMANLGMQGNQQMDQTGQYLRDIQQQQANPELMRQQILAGGMSGGGQASSQTTNVTQMPGTSALQNIGGLASIGMGLFGGPIGAAAGGLLKKGLSGGGGGMPSFGGYQPHDYSGGLNFGGYQWKP